VGAGDGPLPEVVEGGDQVRDDIRIADFQGGMGVRGDGEEGHRAVEDHQPGDELLQGAHFELDGRQLVDVGEGAVAVPDRVLVERAHAQSPVGEKLAALQRLRQRNLRPGTARLDRHDTRAASRGRQVESRVDPVESFQEGDRGRRDWSQCRSVLRRGGCV
jgi:hypothetical protein